MSLDLVVWLSCSVALAQDLPRQSQWHYYKVSAEKIAGLPKELVERLDGHASWQIDRDKYLIRVSKADRVEEADAPAQDQQSPAAKRQAELAERARASKIGISLVLEGNYDAGYPEQAAVAEHLARRCGGGIVEGPAGYYQIDKRGRWIK